MFASNACAVQMLLVAFHGGCAVRACRARGAARFAAGNPWRRRRGGRHLAFEFVARGEERGVRAAITSGTPKRCALPTAMSAPNSPGGLMSVSASKSVATVSSAPAAWAFSAKPE